MLYKQVQKCRFDAVVKEDLRLDWTGCGCVRVNSADQNPERQLEVLGECDRVFTDRLSGSSRASVLGWWS